MVKETGFGMAQRISTHGGLVPPAYYNTVTSYELMEAEIDAKYESLSPYHAYESIAEKPRQSKA